MTALTNALIQRAYAASVAHAKANREFGEAFEARYGVHYSDIDEDLIIDSFDYANGPSFTLAELDKIMTGNGHPPKERR